MLLGWPRHDLVHLDQMFVEIVQGFVGQLAVVALHTVGRVFLDFGPLDCDLGQVQPGQGGGFARDLVLLEVFLLNEAARAADAFEEEFLRLRRGRSL